MGCRAFTTARGKYVDPSETIAMSARLDVELNLLTSAGDQSNDIMNVDVAGMHMGADSVCSRQWRMRACLATRSLWSSC